MAGAEMSIDKLLMTYTEQHLYDTVVALMPQQTLLDFDGSLFSQYLYSRAASIYGGTTQIQLNIIAKSLLALP